MRTIGLLLVAVLSCSLVSAAEVNLRAYYQYTVELEGGSSVTRTSSKVIFGSPVTHDFGDYRLSLLFEPNQLGPEHYSLEVSLKQLARDGNSLPSTLLTQSFAGRLSSPSDFSQSEFIIEEAGIEISIVLRLSQVN